MKDFVDSDHVGDSIDRRSRTGFAVILNNAPIFFCLKKQGSCKMSSFGSEIIAMKTCCEHLRRLLHEPQIFGILVEHLV